MIDFDSRSIEFQEVTRIHNEIEPVLVRRAADWERLQIKILGRVEDYRGDTTLSPSIYRVYTRKDRQSYLGIAHPHLKQFFKIAEEIYINRSGLPKIRSGCERMPAAKNPSFGLYDITDVVGVTIVCPSDDDVDRIKLRIEEDAKEKRFNIETCKAMDGLLYHAYHFIISIDEDPFDQLCCEIQIKTAIQDAFSWKTHALAYKTKEKVSEWHLAQFESVISVLRAADSIIEGISKRIREENDLNEDKRRYARYLLSEKMAADLQRMKGKEDYEFFLSAIQELRAQLVLPVTARSGHRIHETKKQIDEILRKVEHISTLDKFIFRLIALCAIANPRRDASYWLDRIFDQYIVNLEHIRKMNDSYDDRLWHHSLVFSLAYYCRGDLEKACLVLERTISAAKSVSAKVLAPIYSNLAYYYAEQYSQTKSEHFRTHALQHYEKSTAAYGGSVPERDCDFLGYVLIQTGGDIGTVQRGLGMCTSAIDSLLQKSNADEHTLKAGEFFLKLHTEIAYRRIAEFASVACDSAIVTAASF